MSVTNPISIKFGDLTVGGSSSVYQLQGPHVLEKSYSQLRLVFDVQVVGTSLTDLQDQANTLEAAFRSRLAATETLVITLDSASWTYTQGTTLLNAEASCTKSGNPDTDFGATCLYTVTIVAELPADDTLDAGLRDVQVLVEQDASRRRIVTMRGLYTATSSGNAQALYRANFDTVANNYLDAIKSSATWELIEESETWDRHGQASTPAPNVAPFFRQYVELIADQDTGIRDVAAIRDHRFAFRDEESSPGDIGGATRLRSVNGTFDCAVDIDETNDLRGLIEDTIRGFVTQEFESEFRPQVFALESFSGGFDKTTSRIACSFSFVYQGPSDEIVVEASSSLSYVEQRTIDYTPTHGSNELGMYADPGWITKVRVWERTVKAVGSFGPKWRLTADAGSSIPRFDVNIGGVGGPDSSGGSGVNANGWNVIESKSRATPMRIGRPGADQFDVTIVNETVTERYHERPGGRTGTF